MQPMLHPDEHGMTKEAVAKKIIEFYPSEYKSVFGSEPKQGNGDEIEETFVNFSRALAKYVSGFVADSSPFDNFLRQYTPGQDPMFVKGFGEDEWHGFQVFIGKAKCTDCHSGPILTDQEFYFTALAGENLADRKAGLADLINNPYKCFEKEDCQLPPLEEAIQGSIRTPSLRNLGQTAPYFHDGSAPSILEVIYGYMRPAFHSRATDKISTLYLNATETNNLEKFLMTLDSPIRNIYDSKSIANKGQNEKAY